MYDELLVAIAKLTASVNGLSATLSIILIVLVMKETNSNSAVRSLRHELENIQDAILNLTAAVRRKGGQDDV